MKKPHIKTLRRNTLALSIAIGLSGCSLDFSRLFAAGDAGEQAETATSESPYLQRGRQAFERGNYGIAINMLEMELARDPSSLAALNGLGAAYDQLGRYDVAQRYYFRALDLAPDSAMTLANLGYSYELEGRSGDALRLYERALQEQPENRLARTRVGDLGRAAPHIVLDGSVQRTPLEQQTDQPAGPAPTTVADRPAVNGEDILEVASIFALGNSELLADRPVLLEVRNGNGVRGIANATAELLDGQGYSVTGLGNEPGYAVAQTRIEHRPHFRTAAENLAVELDVQARLVETEALSVNSDMLLVLGQDFARQVVVANERLVRVNPVERIDGSLRLEVANGNGVNGMAARVRAWLEDKGGQSIRITNAEHFRHDRSVIYYRSGQRQAADQLLGTLPLRNVALQESDDLAVGVDVRLLIGNDYIPHDA